jgi:hypothetical protein
MTSIDNKKNLRKLEQDRMERIIEKQEKILSELHKKIDKKQKIQTVENMENVSHDKQPKQPKQPNQPINQDEIDITTIPIDQGIREPNDYADPVYRRDRMVIDDKLYPPLGRTERPQYDLLMNYLNNNPDVFYMASRGTPDTFRPLGYLIPKDSTQPMDPNSTLILYGRAKYPSSDIGDFYATSSNKISDIKIPIDNNNSNIRRIWDIPNVVHFHDGMLNGTYNYTELPKPELGTTPYI